MFLAFHFVSLRFILFCFVCFAVFDIVCIPSLVAVCFRGVALVPLVHVVTMYLQNRVT